MSSGMSAAVVGWPAGGDAGLRGWYILVSFQWGFTYSGLYVPWVLVGRGQGGVGAARHCRWQYEVFRFS